MHNSKWNKYGIASCLAGIVLLALCSCSGAGPPGPAGQQGLPGPQGPPGPAGAGISNASIDSSGHLIITLSDGKTLDAGSVVVTPPPAVTPTTSIMTMGDLFSQVQPTLVRVDVQGATFEASGSGIIIRTDGYIITNQHVIDKATFIAITLDNNRQYAATVTASDADLDLAILKLNNSPAGLRAGNLGTPADIATGGVVIAAGFPLGSLLEGPPSYTQGIISAIRTLGGQKYIQTDVQINPGSSGGALITRTTARIIGITTAGLNPPGEDIEGIGLAIPIDVILAYIDNNLK